ncbi:4Fe-4S binding protein [Desulfovulcanus sp.]
MVKKIAQTLTGLWSLVVGLRVTGKNFFQPQLTVHYPREKVESIEGYRGHIELVPKDGDPFAARCVACGSCARACPSGCITIHVKKVTVPAPSTKQEHPASPKPLQTNEKVAPPKKAKTKRVLEAFELNYNYCSLCGLCVQSCPAGGLRFSDNVYIAGLSRNEFEFDLLARMRGKAKQES